MMFKFMCSQLIGESEETSDRMERTPSLVIWLYSHMIGACLFLFTLYYRSHGDNSLSVPTASLAWQLATNL
jgi:Flp pilus assembly protein protease CpaA